MSNETIFGALHNPQRVELYEEVKGAPTEPGAYWVELQDYGVFLMIIDHIERFGDYMHVLYGDGDGDSGRYKTTNFIRHWPIPRPA